MITQAAFILALPNFWVFCKPSNGPLLQDYFLSAQFPGVLRKQNKKRKLHYLTFYLHPREARFDLSNPQQRPLTFELWIAAVCCHPLYEAMAEEKEMHILPLEWGGKITWKQQSVKVIRQLLNVSSAVAAFNSRHISSCILLPAAWWQNKPSTLQSALGRISNISAANWQSVHL